MSGKVVDIAKKKGGKLWVCLICHEHWHGVELQCPKCKSYSVIEDQLYLAPKGHNVYTCTCNDNQFFKIVKDPKHGVYFKCVLCGKKHYPDDLTK